MRQPGYKTGISLLLGLCLYAPAAAANPSASAPDFAVAGTSARSVDKFLHALQVAVARDQRTTVATLISYPVSVYQDKRGLQLKNPRDFLAHYRDIFTAPVRKAIAAAHTGSLFVNYKGVMIGEGEVWFQPVGKSGELKIITFNVPAR